MENRKHIHDATPEKQNTIVMSEVSQPIPEEVLVHLALGSNLGNRAELLKNACLELEELPLTSLARSPVVESPPILGMEQPDFLNQVVYGYTVLGPEILLNECHAIEARLDRVRGEHWGPRTIDIDILSYGSYVISSESLQIPHPELENRAFFLLPLKELSPGWIHPLTGLSIETLWEHWKKDSREPLPRMIGATV